MMDFLLVPLCAALDRVWGGGLSKYDKEGDGIKLPFVVAVIGAVTAYFTLGLLSAVLVLGWVAQRSIKPNGAFCPTRKQIPTAILRHSAAIPFMLIPVLVAQQGLNPLQAIPAVGYVVVAMGIALAYRREVDELTKSGYGQAIMDAHAARFNMFGETLRGAAYGLALAFIV